MASCPKDCSPDATCPGGTNSDGCPEPDICVPITYGENGNECPTICPVTCPEDHMKCNGGEDALGCKRPETCVSNSGNHSQCMIHYPKFNIKSESKKGRTFKNLSLMKYLHL